MVEWRQIPGYEGYYEVSDDGQVRSLPRNIRHWRGGTRRLPGRLLKLTPDSDGYPFVHLSRDGIDAPRNVHRLVLEAFVGQRPEGLQALHEDGTRTNNNLGNLRWGTPTENSQDSLRHGTNKEARKERCPRLHLLDAPNLHRAGVRLGRRRCRSCHQAFAACKRNPDLDMQVESDRRYMQILGPTHPDAARLTAVQDLAQILTQHVADPSRDSTATGG